MGLLKKIFGTDANNRAAAAPSSQFQEANLEQASPRTGPRRELVQVLLRETMRAHGVPSDWIECRILSVVRRSSASGIHVHFVVREGHDRLLTYIPAFQRSFMAEVEKFEPRHAEWLLSLSWQFEQLTDASGPRMPDPSTWKPAAASDDDEDVMQDLKALFAIRDAAIAQPQSSEPPDFEITRPGFEPTDGGALTGR